MKLITKNSDYALRAVVYLAKNRKAFSSSLEIAGSEKIPPSLICADSARLIPH